MTTLARILHIARLHGHTSATCRQRARYYEQTPPPAYIADLVPQPCPDLWRQAADVLEGDMVQGRLF